MKVLKRKSVFLKWFLSYLIMLALVMLFSIGIYFYSYHIINTQTIEMNETLLEKLQTEMDNYFQTAKVVVHTMLLDNNVQKAAQVRGEFTIGDHEMLYHIHSTIMNQCASVPAVSHIFIYFTGGGTVISEKGHMDSGLFYDLYYSQDNWSKEDFKNFMEHEWVGNVEAIQNSRGEIEILFLQNAFPRGLTNPKATFAVSITDTMIRNWLKELKWGDSQELLLVSGDDILIGTGNAAAKILGNGSYSPRDLVEMDTIELDGASYLLSKHASQETDFYYVVLAPIGDIRQGARNIQIFMIVGLIVCITLGIAAAYILTGINYHPLRHIMDMFGNYGQEGEPELRNEYQWLTEQTIQFLEEHREIKRKFYNSEQILKNQYLYRLLLFPYEKKNSYTGLLSQESDFSRPFYLVILLYLTYKDNSQWQPDVESGLFRFILLNVMKELMDKNFGLEMVDLGDSYACIVNTSCTSPETREELEAILDQTQKFVQERMALHIFAACGDFCAGLDGIHESCQMAREASDYRNESPEQPCIWYEDIQNQRTFYDYSVETEQKIINAMKAGEEQNASQWIGEVIDANFVQKGIGPVMKKYLLFELFGTMIKGAEQGEGTDFLKHQEGAPDFSLYMEADAAKIYFNGMLSELCREINHKQQEKKEDRQFGKRVMEYVNKHYQDPDLNISITALHFNITPSYLSSLFKEQTGLSLLGYINNTRVEKVKELLSAGYSVVDICPLTGFRNSGALIRVFKKTTGITPGQMKKLTDK